MLSQVSARCAAVAVVLALQRLGGLLLLVRFYAWLLAWQLLLPGLLGLLSVWRGELAAALLVVPVLVPPLLRVGGLPLPLRVRRLVLVPLVVARLVCLAGRSTGDVACPHVAGPGCGATMPTLPTSSWKTTAGLLSVGGLLWLLLPLLLLQAASLVFVLLAAPRCALAAGVCFRAAATGRCLPVRRLAASPLLLGGFVCDLVCGGVYPTAVATAPSSSLLVLVVVLLPVPRGLTVRCWLPAAFPVCPGGSSRLPRSCPRLAPSPAGGA